MVKGVEVVHVSITRVESRRAREREKRNGKMLSSLPRASARVYQAVSRAGEGRAQSTLTCDQAISIFFPPPPQKNIA